MIRRLAGDKRADALASVRVRQLLAFPDVHPYTKYWGTHWRLVALADLAVPHTAPGLTQGIEQELAWLTAPEHRRKIRSIGGLVRWHASMEGNAVYALSKLGRAGDRRTRTLVDSLLEWQWPDGGWNCDVKASGRRSSFHETVTPALGLAAYHEATRDRRALAAARRAAELLLEHRMLRSRRGEVIHPSWIKLHYPPYWHYDILQGLRLLDAVGQLGDPRAGEALDLLLRARRRDGSFAGRAWNSSRDPDAVDWGRGSDNDMLTLRGGALLLAGGRA